MITEKNRPLKKLIFLFGLIISLCLICGCEPKESAPEVLEVVEISKIQAESLQKSLTGELDVSVSARGNAITYSYRFLRDVSGDLPALKQSLKSDIEGQAGEYTAIVSDLKARGVYRPSLVIEYRSIEGKLVFSKKFK